MSYASRKSSLEGWTASSFAGTLRDERADDPTFDTLVSVMFDSDAVSLATTYFNMDATRQASWIAAKPALWARLLKFLA